MGSTQSYYAGTPLGCMLDNWQAFRRQSDFGVPLSKDKLIKFCTIEWTTFGVDWPDGGTLKLEVVQAVHNIVTRDGHWDQYPYIDIWQDLVSDSPPWLQKCRQNTLQILMARIPIKRQSRVPTKKPCPPLKSCPPPVIPQAPEYVLPPPLYPGLQALDRQMTVDTGSEHPPAGIEKTSPTEIQIPEQEREENGDENEDGVYKNTRLATAQKMFPLRETIGKEGKPAMIYVPFATSDLYNWKLQNPPFSEDPAPLTAIFEMLITAHNPTWGDMQVVLNVLLTPDERRMVLAKAREWADKHKGTFETVGDLLPDKDPEWSHDNIKSHQRYATTIVEGMKQCIRKTPNWAKLYNIRQERKENPAAFYERLCETCRRYTDLNPEDKDGKAVLTPLFIGQSYEDIRKKLQKIPGASGKNIEELLELALKVYDRRDEEERKKGAKALVMALRQGQDKDGKQNRRNENAFIEDGGKPRRPRLGRNQCALCRQEGHWKNECPNRHMIRQGRRTETIPPSVLYNAGGSDSESPQ